MRILNSRAKVVTSLVSVLSLGFAILTSAITQPAAAAVSSAPTITSISRVAGGLTVSFTAPSAVSPAITNYEYSINGGSTWVSPLTPITGSPFSITGLVDCQNYLISVRAINSDGPGQGATAWNGVPGSLQYHLNNGLMKFGSDGSGNGEVESIMPSGNLKQPWYKNANGG